MKTVTVLSSEESQKAVAQIDSLRERWFKCGDMFNFYSLGAASYLDLNAKKGNSVYYERAEQLNPLLSSEFDWLYVKLLSVLSSYTEKPCQLAERQALPGFHIFNAHPAFTKPLASVHIDLQYEGLDWQEREQIEFDDHTISFTLSLELPSAGAGINCWSYTLENLPSWQERANPIAFVERNPPTYCPYTVGDIFIHSGTMLHQIAPIKKYIAGERRITLQGHGVLKRDSGYLIYW